MEHQEGLKQNPSHHFKKAFPKPSSKSFLKLSYPIKNIEKN